MKKIFYRYIIMLFTIIFGTGLAFSAEGAAQSTKDTTADNIQQVITDIRESSKNNENYPVIDAFKQSEDVPDKEKESITVKGSIETNAIMSLDDAIKLALANNPAIMSAISNTEIYQSKIGQAWSQYFPSFSAGIGYDRTKTLMPMMSGVKFSPFDYYKTVSLTAEETLFDFGKTKTQADIAKKSFLATKDNLQATINDTIYAVKEAYYALLFAIQKEEVYQDTVSRYEMHLEQANAYYNIGVKPKIDVLTAEYNLSSAKFGHIKAQNDIELAMAALNNAMGLPELANYSIEEKIKLKKYDYRFDEMIKKAYEVRPELLAAQKRADASNLLVRASKREFTPDLKIAASYNLGGRTFSQDYGYTFGGSLSYPVTNLMRLKKQIDEAKATANKDSADFQKIKQDVYLAVKNAYLNLYETEQTVPVTKNAMLQAQEQYELASGRYKIGVGEIIELKDAENTYRTAQLDYYNAILQYNVAVANLEKVIGIPIEQIANVLESMDL